ncbi:FAD-binding domain-containing [Pyrrhoderma noxium]|uniref:FAD-binding domain-containing n=1 Tax=Pyrrhoderma noxium TaxID=2282107 RepID=A0A286UL83_9AGAM|nr:FAD-binding domain-containing [Pyrrhoderma noxium]
MDSISRLSIRAFSFLFFEVLLLFSPEYRSSKAAEKACGILKSRFPHLTSFPGALQFNNDTEHWAISSHQNATCSIEPGDAYDLSGIIKIIGRSDIRSPFAVKSGGHALAQGYSSTLGVQISMSKFSTILYDEDSNTVTLGTGLTWGEVYKRLEMFGVMVPGARVGPVGVGGFSLGGGYSWKTDQYGLAIDNIVGFELVLPSGEISNVTNKSNPDLFFALKGGLYNFGIVTKITFKTHAQSLGGIIIYPENATLQVSKALEGFSLSNSDPRAEVIVGYIINGGEFVLGAALFYDNSTDNAGIFDEFLSIASISTTVKTSTFTEFLSSMRLLFEFGYFGVATYPVPITEYTTSFLNEVVTQLKSTELRLRLQYPSLAINVSYYAEPFVNANAHSLGGAYPHDPARPTTPSLCFLSYSVDTNLSSGERARLQAVFAAELRHLCHTIQSYAVSEGTSRWDDILYPNYSPPDAPLELFYGSNVPRLKEIAARVDPEKIMTLAGTLGFQ